MRFEPFPITFGRSWFQCRTPCACSALVLLAAPGRAATQPQADVSALAEVLLLEDQRRYDHAVLSTATRHASAIVRRHAALAIGRIGDPTGTTVLVSLLDDPAVAVRQDAAFAIGLMGDPAAFDRLRDLVLGTPAPQHDPAHVEAITAIAKLGGREATTFFREFLNRWTGRAVAGDDLPLTVIQALREAWRLGPEAPVSLLAQFTESRLEAPRTAAIYSAARLRAPGAAAVFVRATDDANPYARAWAARALTAALADSADLDRTSAARRILPLIDDPDPGVRIEALRAIATYRDQSFVAHARERLTDSVPNVQVEALSTLGRLGGAEAARSLADHLERGPFANRRVALLGLSRVARDEALIQSAGWIIADTWMQRAAGAEALGIIGGDTALVWLEDLITDPDGRVAARALGSLIALDSTYAQLVAREVISHPDPAVRARAINHMTRTIQSTDVDPLIAAYAASLEGPTRSVTVAVVRALGRAVELGFSERLAVEDRFLERYPTNRDYLVRRAALESFPAAAERWGPVYPIETGRTLEDYREMASRQLLPAETEGVLPQLVLDTERGRITISLFSADAPMTIMHLLRLADRNYFDGTHWHRVVPNFVIQGGDPRGDGWGGSGVAIRDENNRRRYGRGTVGMALSGPDTGGSQFFITLAPQPHLDGTYTVFGQVAEGMDIVERITQGDEVRTIRRR